MFLGMAYMRAASAADHAFIHNSWLESHWHSYKHIPHAKQLMSIRISEIMSQSKIEVCVDKEDPQVIYGYVVYEPNVTHWVYVKFPLRRQGMATYMLGNITPDALQFHTFETKAGQHFIEKYDSKLTPFIFERKVLDEAKSKDI
jgi:hypothetical protein